MVETQIIVDGESISYEGLFDAHELFMLIDSFFQEKHWDKREIQSMEKVEPDGKYIELELQPYKKITDYVRYVVRIFIRMYNVTEVEIEKDGHKIKQNKGKIQIVFDGFMETDYEGRWEAKPMYIFIRTVFDKFIYKVYTGKFEAGLVDVVNTLKAQVKGFLNLYRYKEDIKAGAYG
ncbi:MAG: hypothetical protein ABIG95_00245 [Candidatus Woesearchaeota archaeon]